MAHFIPFKNAEPDKFILVRAGENVPSLFVIDELSDELKMNGIGIGYRLSSRRMAQERNFTVLRIKLDFSRKRNRYTKLFCLRNLSSKVL